MYLCLTWRWWSCGEAAALGRMGNVYGGGGGREGLRGGGGRWRGRGSGSTAQDAQVRRHRWQRGERNRLNERVADCGLASQARAAIQQGSNSWTSGLADASLGACLAARDVDAGTAASPSPSHRVGHRQRSSRSPWWGTAGRTEWTCRWAAEWIRSGWVGLFSF